MSLSDGTHARNVAGTKDVDGSGSASAAADRGGIGNPKEAADGVGIRPPGVRVAERTA